MNIKAKISQKFRKDVTSSSTKGPAATPDEDEPAAPTSSSDSATSDPVTSPAAPTPLPSLSGGATVRAAGSKNSKVPELSLVDSSNWLVHHLYVRGEWEECEKVMGEAAKECKGAVSRHCIYTRALLHRRRGNLREALEEFEKCAALQSDNVEYMLQVGKSLMLLGKLEPAVKVFEELLTGSPTSILSPPFQGRHGESLRCLGECFLYLGRVEEAIKCLEEAVQAAGEIDKASGFLADIYLGQGKVMEAENLLRRSLVRYPESVDIAASLGMLLIQQAKYAEAIEMFGLSLSHCPTHPPSVMGLAGLVQSLGMDWDVALRKYRIAATTSPDSPTLWNNVGMCFYGKGKFVAAIACLKRAAYLAPLQPPTLVNLGLIHLNMEQFTSAYHYLAAAASLLDREDVTRSPGLIGSPNIRCRVYSLLGVTLYRLRLPEEAERCHQMAVDMASMRSDVGGDDEVTAWINYAVFLWHEDKLDECYQCLKGYGGIWNKNQARGTAEAAGMRDVDAEMEAVDIAVRLKAELEQKGMEQTGQK